MRQPKRVCYQAHYHHGELKPIPPGNSGRRQVTLELSQAGMRELGYLYTISCLLISRTFWLAVPSEKEGPDAERFRCWLLEVGLAKTKVGRVPENGQATNNTHNVQRQTRLNRLNYMVLEVLESFENLVILPAL